MGTTPIYGFRYPEPTDPVADGATNFRNLATDVESKLTHPHASVWAGIPKMVLISGPAGASAANPRILGLSGAYRTAHAPFQVIAGASIKISATGLYRVTTFVDHQAFWAVYLGWRLMRGGSEATRIVSPFSRGTWGNPPGVTGFDPAHVQQSVVAGTFTANVNDEVQVIGYTTGGGDATSYVGSDVGTSGILIDRLGSNAVEDATTAVTPFP